MYPELETWQDITFKVELIIEIWTSRFILTSSKYCFDTAKEKRFILKT
jgi:hypothetical protein